MTEEVAGSRGKVGAAEQAQHWPALVVFDLDDCVWSPVSRGATANFSLMQRQILQEMYTLSQVPTAADAVQGDLGGQGEGVIGVKSGGEVIRLFPGALQVFQLVLSGEYGTMRLAAASSADTPKAVQIGRAAMAILEIIPGVTMLETFRRAGGGFASDSNLQIGRTPPLSSNKAQTHFPILQQFTRIPYEQWLFFDDCNW